MLGWEQIFLSTRQVVPPVTVQLVDLSWDGSYFTIFSIKLSDLIIAISTNDPHLTLSLKPKGGSFLHPYFVEFEWQKNPSFRGSKRDWVKPMHLEILVLDSKDGRESLFGWGFSTCSYSFFIFCFFSFVGERERMWVKGAVKTQENLATRWKVLVDLLFESAIRASIMLGYCTLIGDELNKCTPCNVDFNIYFFWETWWEEDLNPIIYVVFGSI